jgi:hypothetical protein
MGARVKKLRELWGLGVPSRPLERALNARWVGTLLLMQILVCLPTWLLLGPLMWLSRARLAAMPTPGREEVYGAVMLAGFLTFFMCAIGALLHSPLNNCVVGPYLPGPGSSAWALSRTGMITMLSAGLLPPALIFCSCRVRAKYRLLVARRLERGPDEPPLPTWWALQCDDLAGWLISSVIWLLAGAMYCCWLLLLAWGLFLLASGSSSPVSQNVLFYIENHGLDNPLLPFICYSGLLGLLVFYWWLAGFRVPGGHHLNGLRTLRATLGHAILAASAAYLVVSLYGLPARRQADAEMDYWVRHGEVKAALYYGGSGE